MININRELGSYREAVRHLWNSTFASLDESLRYGQSLTLFERIDRLVFSALVCAPLGIPERTGPTDEPMTNLKVFFISDIDVPVMINRSLPACGYWDSPVKVLNRRDVDLALIGFFDWAEYDKKDCRYFRVRIIDCISQPDLMGHDALVERFYADVFLK